MAIEVADLIAKGFIYVSGRDHCFRPLVIIKADVFTSHSPALSLDQSLIAFSYVFEYISKHFWIPGQVENWNVLVDMQGIGITNVPVKYMKGLAQTMQNQY
mmetsp:Transcript_28459/g.21265  ORF Transcript_28459/g.21265 Transcript_28459/m.21265 type:complete len:101 (-) Transcript_28459:582-884(-)